MNNIRKPLWIRSKIPAGNEYNLLARDLKKQGISTVCQEANCPNIGECFAKKTSTIMIMGNLCTRNCKFCGVGTGNPNGHINSLEAQNASHVVKTMGLNYIVITSVDRDDLDDGGASQFSSVIRQICSDHPGVKIEALVPDFCGDIKSIQKIGNASPFVIAHNLETVERLSPIVRDRRASYRQSLKVLKSYKDLYPHIPTKSSIMLGLGETTNEILVSLRDLRESGVSIVTLGQYLRPGRKQLPVEKYYTPEEFTSLKAACYDIGFEFVVSGPMVRSSYNASDYLAYLDEKNV